MGGSESKRIEPWPAPQYEDINPLPPISDGLTGFVPVTTPMVTGCHKVSDTVYGSWVFICTKVNNGRYITASWNEEKRILRAWLRGCSLRENNWRLWEIGPIPEKYFFGGGRDPYGNITFQNCCGFLCTDQCQPDGDNYYCVKTPNPNWIRELTAPSPDAVIPSEEGFYSPCPGDIRYVPCYLAPRGLLLPCE
jgi:hypothetical protein